MSTAFDTLFLEEALRKEKDHLDNVRMLLEDMLDKVQRFIDWNRRDLAEKIGEEIKEHLQHKRHIEAHIKALEEWTPSIEITETDYQIHITDRTQQFLSIRVHIEEQEEYQRYMQLMQKLKKPVSDDDDDDDEVEEITDERNNIAPNTHCPICQKKIEDLEDPVVDQKGYVYEKKMIELHLSQVGQGENRENRCPVAGTSHLISLASLAPAMRVRHLIKNKRKHRRTNKTESIL
eukprot:g8062.t1